MKRNRNEFNHNIMVRSLEILNILLIALPFFICWKYFYSHFTATYYYRRGRLAVILVYIFMYAVLAKTYEAHRMSFYPISEMVYSQALSFLIADGFIYIIIVLLAKKYVNILPGLGCIAMQFILSVVWARTAYKTYYAFTPPKKTAIIFDVREGLEKQIRESGLEKKFDVQMTVQAKKCTANISMLDDYEVVFLRDIHSHERNIILKYCIERDIQTYVIPRLGDIIMSGAGQMHMFHRPILRVGRYNPAPEYLLVKRLFDIVSALVTIVITSPFMLITAVAIHAYDKGPVLYKQVRLTKDGREFKMYKFRSMRVDAEANGVARLSTGENDDRITPVGRFIRKIRFDEIPQLFNILKGDLSVVGPRPERPEIAELYCKELPEFNLRLQAKAGLTGYAQVYGKYNTTPYDKLQMDLMYIANPSVREDLRICFATLKILFMPESTEGIEEGRTNAMEDDEK